MQSDNLLELWKRLEDQQTEQIIQQQIITGNYLALMVLIEPYLIPVTRNSSYRMIDLRLFSKIPENFEKPVNLLLTDIFNPKTLETMALFQDQHLMILTLRQLITDSAEHLSDQLKNLIFKIPCQEEFQKAFRDVALDNVSTIPVLSISKRRALTIIRL